MKLVPSNTDFNGYHALCTKTKHRSNKIRSPKSVCFTLWILETERATFSNKIVRIHTLQKVLV